MMKTIFQWTLIYHKMCKDKETFVTFECLNKKTEDKIPVYEFPFKGSLLITIQSYYNKLSYTALA